MAEVMTAESVHKIDQELLRFAMPIADLTPDPVNANLHDDASIAGIASSLEVFGQDQPIVAQRRPDGVLLVRKGNGRLEAAKQLGWTHVACVVIDEGDTRATARSLADNQTARLSKWDDATLARLLDAVQADDPGLYPQVLGFSPEDMARMAAEVSMAAMEEAALAGQGPAADLSASDKPNVFSVPLTLDQEAVVRLAVDRNKQKTGATTTGEALSAVCQNYLDKE
jgi:ParB-like chromosome segregation protein Spo0J